MIERRLQGIEEDVVLLQIQHAKMEANNIHLASAITKLAVTTETLTEAFNKARGALWIVGLICGFFGALGHWVVEHFSK